MLRPAVALLAAAVLAAPAAAQDYTKTDDVIYGRKFGTALTMDVLIPKGKKNGAGVIFAVSGGFVSDKAMVPLVTVLGRPLVLRGYTVFAVVHGSQPKYTVPEMLEDMHRATRYIRANAKKYDLDPDRIGITGGSAGGYLSLMQGAAYKPGEADAADPVERVSSKTNAVACFYPATDFLNWSKEGDAAVPGVGKLAAFRAPFDFTKFNPKARAFDPITDPEERTKIFRAISPITHISKDTAPTLIAHGDADQLVPIYQSERLVEVYKKAGVPFELVVKKGKDHGWADMPKDVEQFADWFDKHMPKK